MKEAPSEQTADRRETYRTLDHFAAVRFEEKRSVFYGWAGPIRSEEEALELIEKAKKEYPDAGHHVYAWIAGGPPLRNKYSDDGEPGGTAGLPVFDVLRKNRLEDAIVIVIRYFGGILLGSGGLLRAYTETAVRAIREAAPVQMQQCVVFRLLTTYSDLEKIKRTAGDSFFTVDVREYASDVRADVCCPENKRDALLRLIADLSSGRASLEFDGYAWQKSDGPQNAGSQGLSAESGKLL